MPVLQVEIYNALGEKVISQRPAANGQQQVIDVADFSSGIYFIRLLNGKQQLTRKIVVQH